MRFLFFCFFLHFTKPGAKPWPHVSADSVNNLTSFLKGIYFLEKLDLHFCALNFGKWNAVLLAILIMCISVFSLNHVSVCAESAACSLPCAPPRFDTSFRIFFVLIWIKWLREPLLHCFYSIPCIRKIVFMLASLAFLFSPPLPLPHRKRITCSSRILVGK